MVQGSAPSTSTFCDLVSLPVQLGRRNVVLASLEKFSCCYDESSSSIRYKAASYH